MQYDLVFEGGGAKGVAFVGAMQAFESAGHTIGRIIGTSAGAITAASLAAGYSAEEMLAVLTETVDSEPVFTTFLGKPAAVDQVTLYEGALADLLRSLDIPLLPEPAERRIDRYLLDAVAASPRWRNLVSFVENGGWYAADAFENWFTAMLNQGSHNGELRRYGEMTLLEMYEVSHVDLTLTASDVTGGRLLILNHRTAPKLPVVKAVRMSMSVPLLWQEVLWVKEWDSYRENAELAGHAIVDGGLLSNFPIELLISKEKFVTDVMGDGASNPVLGFLIDEGLPVPAAPPRSEEPGTFATLGASMTARRLRRLVDTVTQARDKMVMDEFERLVVRLPAKGYGTIEFDMDDDRRLALIEAANAATRTYFQLNQFGGQESMTGQSQGVVQAKADKIAAKILDMGDW